MSSTSAPDFQAEIRSLWRTRPVRTPDDAKIAGVCGGFGRRYGIDPVLFRVAFVVTALWGGVGVFLYALLWLLLRDAGDEASTGESLLGRGESSGSKGTAIVLVVVVLISAPTIGSGATFLVSAGFLMVLAMLAGWYGLYRRTPEPPAGWAAVSAVRPSPSRGGTHASPRPGATDAGTPWTPGATGEPGSGPHAPFGPPVPPSWDPLGAAPFAWDLPEPGADQPDPEPTTRRSRLTIVTLGLAIIAASVATGLSTLAGLTWIDATVIAAIALAVVAGGLLVGAVTRRGHGLLIVAGPLAGFVLLSSLVQIPEGGWENVGELNVEITEPAQLATPVTHELGSLIVDMRGLELDADHTFSIDNNVGEVQVQLPDDLNVDLTCRADVGSVDCPDLTGDATSGPVLTLDVATDVGSVTVTR